MKFKTLKALVLAMEQAGAEPDTYVEFWLDSEAEAFTRNKPMPVFVNLKLADGLVEDLHEHKVPSLNAYSLQLSIEKDRP